MPIQYSTLWVLKGDWFPFEMEHFECKNTVICSTKNTIGHIVRVIDAHSIVLVPNIIFSSTKNPVLHIGRLIDAVSKWNICSTKNTIGHIGWVIEAHSKWNIFSTKNVEWASLPSQYIGLSF